MRTKMISTVGTALPFCAWHTGSAMQRQSAQEIPRRAPLRDHIWSPTRRRNPAKIITTPKTLHEPRQTSRLVVQGQKSLREMPSLRIMAFKVVRCRPRRVAALVTTPPLSRNTRMICSLHLLERGAVGNFRRILSQFAERSTKAGSTGQDDRSFNEILE